MSVGRIIGLVLLVVGVLLIVYGNYQVSEITGRGYGKYVGADQYIKIIAGVVLGITGGIIMIAAKKKE